MHENERFLKRFYLFIFRERGREGEREGEKYQCVVASLLAPTGDLACHPGMCPDWEMNWAIPARAKMFFNTCISIILEWLALFCYHILIILFLHTCFSRWNKVLLCILKCHFIKFQSIISLGRNFFKKDLFFQDTSTGSSTSRMYMTFLIPFPHKIFVIFCLNKYKN